GFETLVAQVSLPVYALGGMTVSDVTEVRKRGGQGIAGIRCFRT
ncbi:MAG: DNA mismatch repair protein MutT, partial [Gammaproteobacteria bacterium]|nr:DNA mismatch repair protein MutT [Gammaproteobacteria bacterium]